jgi:hypothetical protein
MRQFISGHGDFNSKLKTFRLSEVDTCDCDMEETPQDIPEDCSMKNRQKLGNAILVLELNWPKEKWELITKGVYPHFQQFTKSVLLAKEQKRRTALQEMRGPL